MIVFWWFEDTARIDSRSKAASLVADYLRKTFQEFIYENGKLLKCENYGVDTQLYKGISNIEDFEKLYKGRIIKKDGNKFEVKGEIGWYSISTGCVVEAMHKNSV